MIGVYTVDLETTNLVLFDCWVEFIYDGCVCMLKYMLHSPITDSLGDDVKKWNCWNKFLASPILEHAPVLENRNCWMWVKKDPGGVGSCMNWSLL